MSEPRNHSPKLKDASYVNDVEGVNKVDEGIANTVYCQSNFLENAKISELTGTHLQSFWKSILRYMKSYLPQLDSSTITFNICWSTLLGMLRNMICIGLAFGS